MKKSTCKVLISIGIVWMVLISLITLSQVSVVALLFPMIASTLVFSFPGIILIIIGWAKWNSENEK